MVNIPSVTLPVSEFAAFLYCRIRYIKATEDDYEEIETLIVLFCFVISYELERKN